MNPIISAIVPVYNGEKYIFRCIESILAQTFKDFELLIVNDGSYDNTSGLCEHFAQNDQRIKVFQQDNRGVSAARNLGIENAKGKYILFIDADDEVLPSYFNSLYFSPQIPKKILIFQNHLLKSEFEGKNNIQNNSDEEYLITKLQSAEQRPAFLFTGPPWAKLFDLEIIQNKEIRFVNVVNEDHIFHLEYLLHLSTIKKAPGADYIYNNINDQSNSLKRLSFENSYKSLQTMVPLTQKVICKFKIQNKKLIRSIYSTPVTRMISAIHSLYLHPYKKDRAARIVCLKRIIPAYRYIITRYAERRSFILLANYLAMSCFNYTLIDAAFRFLIWFRYSVWKRAVNQI